jgi:voltage-dependent anion channel protein 2
MPTYFGDIAKAAKDLLTGSVNFDNKASIDAKNVADGLKITGNCVQKGGAGDPTGTLKATYDLASDVVAEAEVGVPSNKISASLAHSGLVKGMKATLSGNPQDVKTAKLALQYLYGAVGVKADITELTAGAPKADINLCWADGDHAAGVSGVTVDKSFDPAALPKKLSWSVQSTGVVPDSTVALALSDAFDTVKASVVTKIDKDTTTGAEVVYKRAKGTATGSLGLSKRFLAACTGKAVVTSPLPLNGASAAPVLTLQTTGDVFANTTGSASVQVDTAAKYKYGFQFATKV